MKVFKPLRTDLRTKLRTMIFAGLASMAGSCSNNEDLDPTAQPLARVYDKVLYFDDIKEMVPKGIGKEDSILMVQNIIYNWGKDQLMVAKAEFNLGDDQKDFEELVEQYRSDLLKFTYQQEYINQNLDTNISETEIQEYYAAHPQDFELKENIVKVRFAVLPREIPKYDEIRKLFRKTSEEDREELQNLLLSYATNFNITDTNWVSFEKLTEIIPVRTYNQQEFLQRNSFVTLDDSLSNYILVIDKYKVKESVSPLPYIRNTIKSIILNQRKLTLIEEMEKKLVEDAYDKKDFEIY